MTLFIPLFIATIFPHEPKRALRVMQQLEKILPCHKGNLQIDKPQFSQTFLLSQFLIEFSQSHRVLLNSLKLHSFHISQFDVRLHETVSMREHGFLCLLNLISLDVFGFYEDFLSNVVQLRSPFWTGRLKVLVQFK